MNTKNILILGAVAVGGWWLWKKYTKNPTTTGTTDTKPQREIAPKPQTNSPNVQPNTMANTEATNTSVKNFMDFDGEPDFN